MARENECRRLEQLVTDKDVDLSIGDEQMSGIYSRSYATPQCAQCVHLQADNRALLCGIYKRQEVIIEMLGGDNNDSCCCFVIKFG